MSERLDVPGFIFLKNIFIQSVKQEFTPISQMRKLRLRKGDHGAEIPLHFSTMPRGPPAIVHGRILLGLDPNCSPGETVVVLVQLPRL